MLSTDSLDSQDIDLLKLCDVEHREAERLAVAMRHLSAEMARMTAAVARRLGVSEHELEALGVLDLAGGLTPGQLGARLGLTSGAVTALADRLERHGLVRRVPHPTDRRSTLLCATTAAEGFGLEAYGPLGAEAAALLAERTPAEREAILAFLEAAGGATARHADVQEALSRGAPRARPAP